MGITFAANAQKTDFNNYSGKAIGIRGGSGGSGSGVDFSYQQLLGQQNRLEFDAGYNTGEYINAAVAYHWRFPIIEEFDFGWFIGPTVNVGYCINHGLGISAGVQGGVEWSPNFLPLQFSVDGRPMYDFLMDPDCYYKGFICGVAIGVRYKIPN